MHTYQQISDKVDLLFVCLFVLQGNPIDRLILSISVLILSAGSFAHICNNP